MIEEGIKKGRESIVGKIEYGEVGGSLVKYEGVRCRKRECGEGSGSKPREDTVS